jgi:hypothetical protein
MGTLERRYDLEVCDGGMLTQLLLLGITHYPVFIENKIWDWILLLSSGKNYTQLGPIDGADPEMGTSYVC